MQSEKNLSADFLRQVLDYDPETGGLTWRERPASMFSDGRRSASHSAAVWNSRYSGKPALMSIRNGYSYGAIFDRLHQAHRVAWLLHYGVWPSGQVDHKNGDRSDNRIANLRDVTNAENGRNQKRHRDNTSGVTGVCWHRASGKWNARIKVGARNKSLGLFADFDAAVSARKAAEVDHGYSLGHGRGGTAR